MFEPPLADFDTACTQMHEHDPATCTPENPMTNHTDADQLLKHTAKHIAANLGIEINLNLRNDHDTDVFGDFQAAVTPQQLLDEYDAASVRAAIALTDTHIPLPRFVTVIDEAGQEVFIQFDHPTLNEKTERVNAVLTALAKAIALDQAAEDARQDATALLVAFHNTEQPAGN